MLRPQICNHVFQHDQDELFQFLHYRWYRNDLHHALSITGREEQFPCDILENSTLLCLHFCIHACQLDQAQLFQFHVDLLYTNDLLQTHASSDREGLNHAVGEYKGVFQSDQIRSYTFLLNHDGQFQFHVDRPCKNDQ